MKVFGFVLARKAEHSIALMCRVLEVSRSGYHAWAARPLSARGVEDVRLSARIGELHALRRGVYGSPRIWADLVIDDGERIGRERVERLMRQAGLSGLITKYRAGDRAPPTRWNRWSATGPPAPASMQPRLVKPRSRVLFLDDSSALVRAAER